MKNILVLFIVLIVQNSFSQTKFYLCDSIYPKKGYIVSLTNIKNSDDENESKNNIIFTFYKKQKNKKTIFYQEHLYSHFKNVEFEDFNGDNIKDILVEYVSDVRSNLHYHLFLVDLKKNKLIKIINFDKIKNPVYLKKYNLVSNLVMSGRNWSSFYKIKNNNVKDFGYTFYWQDENGNDSSIEDYDKILNNILKTEKKNKK